MTKRKVLKSFENLELIEVEGGGMLFYQLKDAEVKIAQDDNYFVILNEFHKRVKEPITTENKPKFSLQWLKENY